MIRLKSVVLPAPLGPMIARRSPGGTARSTPLTAWTPPKCLRRPTRAARTRRLARWRRLPPPRRPPTRPTKPCGRTTMTTITIAAEEERPVHRPLPADQPLEDLEAEGPGQRAEERLHAAQQGHHQRLEGLGEVGEVGEDAAVVEGEEAAGQPREGARDDEGDELVAAHVDADEAGAARVLADRLERVAEGRVDDGVQGAGCTAPTTARVK